MNQSVLDILKEMNLPFRNSKRGLFDKSYSNALKPHLKKLDIQNTDEFINELSVENAIKKLNEFKFEKTKTNFKFVAFSKQEISNPNLEIYYQIYKTKIGQILIASTEIGVCYVAFETKEKPSFLYLKEIYPNAKFILEMKNLHQTILDFIDGNENVEITFHIKGTEFQFDVWKALLEIPKGSLTSYGAIANKIKKPKAFRAVGTAIGNNPISLLIPCHRVIQSSGNFGGYMWGLPTKFLLIGWEGLQK